MRIVKSPILFLGTIVLLYWFGVIIYYSWRDFPHVVNWGTIFAFVYALITCVIIIANQFILKILNFNIRSIWIGELVLIIAFLGIYSHQERKIIYEVSDKIEWFAIVENPHSSEKVGKYSFPFNRKFEVGNRKILFVHPTEKEGFKYWDIKRNEIWNGRVSISRSITVDEEVYRIQVISQFNNRIGEDEYIQIKKMIGDVRE